MIEEPYQNSIGAISSSSHNSNPTQKSNPPVSLDLQAVQEPRPPNPQMPQLRNDLEKITLTLEELQQAYDFIKRQRQAIGSGRVLILPDNRYLQLEETWRVFTEKEEAIKKNIQAAAKIENGLSAAVSRYRKIVKEKYPHLRPEQITYPKPRGSGRAS